MAAGPAAGNTLADVIKGMQGSGTGLFGTQEFTSGSLKALPQWRRILQQMKSELPAFVGCAEQSKGCDTPARQAWRRLIKSAAPLDRMGQLHAVNRFFNRWPYKLDREIYGRSEYWATPSEFMVRSGDCEAKAYKLDREIYGRSEYWATPSEFMVRSGDCEDYSIAKFFALRQLGLRNDEMRVVIIYDSIRALGHAVTAVYQDNDILILDSLSNLIASHLRYKQYIPQYSMNETTRWAHVDRTRKIPRSAFRAPKS